MATAALPESSAAEMSKQQRLMDELELRRRMKAVVVPTDDAEVRRLLRAEGEPITLFGERELERSERLRRLYAESGRAGAAREAPAGAYEAPPSTGELFYTEGSEELQQARLQIARESISRAARRLDRERAMLDENGMDHTLDDDARLCQLGNQVSELADERPVAGCSFSPDGSQLLLGSWSGVLKVWDATTCRPTLTVRAHTDRVTGVAWNPQQPVDTDESVVAFVSGSSDASAKLWSRGGSCLVTLAGHTDRLGRVAFHPLGRHVGTASFDTTWRLWDVATGACLQEQEGHSRAVYGIAFQGDGSLAATGGMDAVGRVWDLRTGRNVLKLEGHVKPVLAVDFSPNGYCVATGSEDNTARVFDLRRRGTLAVLPGHSSLISQVAFEPEQGRYLLTCGYDGASKVWAGDTFRLTKTLVGHEGKVMSGDIAPGGGHVIATTGYDRTLKLYYPDPLAEAA